jgi:alpha-2-macroglobulin-like protein
VMGDREGQELLDKLLPMQASDGSWSGTSHSVMHGYGQCFTIETTALAALALLKTGKNSAPLQKAVDYLIRSKTGYGYGSTQSTVMTLKALIEYLKLDKKSAQDGTFQVLVDGKKTGQYAFKTKVAQKLEIKDLNQYFTHPNPKIEVVFDNPEVVIPFDLDIKYTSRQPQDAPNCPLALTTTLDKKATTVGETVRMTATLKNTQNIPQASPMIVIGIPSGLSLQPWQLKKLVDEKQVDYYELWDGYAVFHFESMAANTTKNIALDLRAEVPGVYEAPASQAFLYYTNDQRVWSKPEKVTIR